MDVGGIFNVQRAQICIFISSGFQLDQEQNAVFAQTRWKHHDVWILWGKSCFSLWFLLGSIFASLVIVCLPQDLLDSSATQEDSSGMDVEAEAVRDAENNINTARSAGEQLASRIYQQINDRDAFLSSSTQNFVFCCFCDCICS